MGMDFANARQRVRGLVAAKKPTDLARSALTPDPLRDNVIAEEASMSERFKAATRNHPQIEYDVTTEQDDGTKKIERKQFDWTAWPEMLRDVARASYGYDEPEVVRPEEMRPSHRLNREIMAELHNTPEFQESRPYTRGLGLESLFNALAIQKSIREQAPERLAEHIQRAKELEEQEEQQSTAQQMLDDLRARAKFMKDTKGKVPDDLKQEIKNAVASKNGAKSKIEQLTQAQAQSNLVLDAAAVAQEAAKEGAKAVEAMSSLPGIGGGHSQNLTPDQQLELAERWSENDQLQKIARMLGRMYRDMRFKRETRVKNVPIEPVGITTGRDIERVLPTELARGLSDNKLIQATFLKDFAQESLLQVQMRGKIPAGKGPIICVTDGSGSMNGDRMVWAQSLALTLMTIAQREQRAFAGIQFGSAGQLKSWQFPAKTPIDAELVLDYASHFFGGGTSTVTGMTEALRIINEQPEFSTADIILIGDGQDTYREPDIKVKAALVAKDVRVHGISIMTPDNAYMGQMCEYVVDVTDLAGTNEATDAVATNIT